MRLSVALVCAACAAVDCAQGAGLATNDVRLVVIDVHPTDGADVVFAKMEPRSKEVMQRHKVKYPPQRRSGPGAATDMLHVLFHSTPSRARLNAAPEHMLSFDNPRRRHAHSWNEEAERFESGFEYDEHAMVELYIPDYVDSIVVEDGAAGMSFEVAAPPVQEVRAGLHGTHARQRRGAQTLADDWVEITTSLDPETGVESPLPRSGPVETQQNFVFLAGGYLASQKDLFRKDLEEVINVLTTSCKGDGAKACSGAEALEFTVPYRRYFSTFNVFAIFQPSRQEGASRPTEGRQIDNNLECSYGTTVVRQLWCTRSLVMALASTAPCGAAGKENVVVITLVNSQEYGGAASYTPTNRLGAFSMRHFDLADSKERSKFASLFFHEVGHCYADLSDEYDTTQTESRVKTMTNCAYDVAVGKQQWQGWHNYDLSAIPSTLEKYFTISPQAVPVCGYTNYHKCSDDCFMEKLSSNGVIPRLCPVCREGTVNTMYDTGMDVTYPKCPINDEIIHIDDTRGAYIFINSKIATWVAVSDGGPVNVRWGCNSSGVADRDLSAEVLEAGYIKVTSAIHETCGGAVGGTISISVRVDDDTVWVTSKSPAMTQTHYWDVVRVADAAAAPGVAKSKCYGGKLPAAVSPAQLKKDVAFDPNSYDFEYYSTCKAESCELSYSTRAYNSSAAGASRIADVENLITGPAGIIAAAVLVFFLFSWWMLARTYRYANANNVYQTKYDKPVKVVRAVIIIAGVIFFLLSVAAITWGIMQYNDVGEFLKLALIAAFILCLWLFIMAFVGVTAAYFRARWMLFINSFGLFVCLCMMGYFTHVVMYIADNIQNTGCSNGEQEAAAADGLGLPPCALDDSDIALCGIEGVGCELRELWKTLVKNYPEKICAFQDELKCSGYLQPCNRQPSLDYCPAACESNQEYADACKVKLQDDVADHCERLTPMMIVLTIVMGLAFVNNLILGCLITQQKKFQRKAQTQALNTYTQSARAGGNVKKATDIPEGQNNRAIRLLCALSKDQRVTIARRFNRADKDGNGTLDRREFGLFIRSVLASDLTKKEIDGAFAAGDTDKNGNLDFSEFCRLFSVDEEMGGNPLAKPSPNFRAADNGGGWKPNRTRGLSKNAPSSDDEMGKGLISGDTVTSAANFR